MAEFQEVMRQWKRRCEHCDAKENVHCYVHGYTCSAFNKMKKYTNFQSVEEEIMKWAAEHPEPVYPTWGKWLHSLHVVGVHAMCAPEPNFYYPIDDKFNAPIPADIAEKLGLQPKEG